MSSSEVGKSTESVYGSEYTHKIDKECQGCLVNDVYNPACALRSTVIHKTISISCPCQQCIIKMVCINACSRYTEFANLVAKEREAAK